MPFPIDATHLLAYAGTNEPLRIGRVPFESLRARLASDGLHEGDEIVCEHDASGGMLVTAANGQHVTVDLKYAVVIEVTPVAPHRSPRLRRGARRRRSERAV